MTQESAPRYTDSLGDVEELTVSEDPTLLPEEKQFSLTGTKADGKLTVHSEVASVSRWLLRHPAFELSKARCSPSGSEVWAVTGRIPIGMVDLKGKPRVNDRFGRMLSSATLRGRSE